MKCNVSPAQAGMDEVVLPKRVQEALGQLVGVAREGLLALSVGVGLGVLAELMEEEVDEVVGPKGRHDPDRVAVRHGHEGGEVTLGGRRVQVGRPRVRSADGQVELPLASYAHFADRDPLTRIVLERMLAGVSTRRYRRTQEPVGAAVERSARSTSKSSVSRAFIERTRVALAELMEEEVDEVVGLKGRHDPDRVAVRHGHEQGEVTLGGRRVQVERPRVRSADGQVELPLASYAHFADRDPLTRIVLERMLAGVSTRRYRRTQEPVGAAVERSARSTSKSSVSRAFIERTRKALAELMGRRLGDVRLAVLMLDGIELQGRTNIVALGISTEGVKIPLGLWEGSTENATVATALLSDLVERGLDPAQEGILFVIDGAKALRQAIRLVFGEAPIQRCVRHKERNVLEHLPERDRPAVKRRYDPENVFHHNHNIDPN